VSTWVEVDTMLLRIVRYRKMTSPPAYNAATAKPVDALVRKLTQVTGIERLTREIYGKAGFPGQVHPGKRQSG